MTLQSACLRPGPALDIAAGAGMMDASRTGDESPPTEEAAVKTRVIRRFAAARMPLLALAAFAAIARPGLARAGAAEEAPRVRTLRVTVLSTMLADTKGIGEWGFAARVEADGHRLLFDTGARPDTVLANARELRIDLSTVEEVVLSHHHGDHTGGLLTLRRAQMAIKSTALCRPGPLPEPASTRRPRVQRDGRPEGAVRGDRRSLR